MKAVFVLALAIAWQLPATNILPAYRELLKEGDAVKRVAMMYNDRCGAANGPFTLLRADTPARDAAQIARQIDAAGVPALIDRALNRATYALPGASVTICSYAAENVGGLPYLGGVGGISLGGGRIKLFLHPAPNGLPRVEYTVAHEYHHEVERLLGPPMRAGTLNNAIREGKADHFAVALYPQFRPAHTQPLTTDELRATWSQLADAERSGASLGAAFMIGRFPDGIRWPGYRLGFEMVDAYAKSARLAPAALIKVPADVIASHFRATARGQLAAR